MKERKLILPEFDVQRLKRLLNSVNNRSDNALMKSLTEEFDHAQVVPSREIPPDVVTMNSRVRITDLETGEESVYTIVFPTEADTEKNKLSVLAPLGTALLGDRVGSVVEWAVPGGTTRIRIEEIEFQPEAAGMYPEEPST